MSSCKLLLMRGLEECLWDTTSLQRPISQRKPCSMLAWVSVNFLFQVAFSKDISCIDTDSVPLYTHGSGTLEKLIAECCNV